MIYFSNTFDKNLKQSLKKTHSFAPSFNLRRASGDPPSFFFINSSMSTKFVNGPLEHERQTRDALDSDSSKLDDVVTTSKAVSWPKVRNWILDHMLKSR